MHRLNIEIKARSHHSKKIQAILEAHQADFKGIDHQIDTYFNVHKGRLKLREGTIEQALIHYQRNNQAGPKKSTVLLYTAPTDAALKAVLTAACGILTVVDKERAIYFIENVKFHIDKVKNLGSFVEIEAIDADGSIGEEQLQAQCRYYMQLLRISEDDLVDVSYSDLLLKAAEQV